MRVFVIVFMYGSMSMCVSRSVLCALFALLCLLLGTLALCACVHFLVHAFCSIVCLFSCMQRAYFVLRDSLATWRVYFFQ